VIRPENLIRQAWWPCDFFSVKATRQTNCFDIVPLQAFLLARSSDK